MLHFWLASAKAELVPLNKIISFHLLRLLPKTCLIALRPVKLAYVTSGAGTNTRRGLAMDVGNRREQLGDFCRGWTVAQGGRAMGTEGINGAEFLMKHLTIKEERALKAWFWVEAEIPVLASMVRKASILSSVDWVVGEKPLRNRL